MRYDANRAVMLLSVRELCAYALRDADLDLRHASGRAAMLERAAIGAKVHRKLQVLFQLS